MSKSAPAHAARDGADRIRRVSSLCQARHVAGPCKLGSATTVRIIIWSAGIPVIMRAIKMTGRGRLALIVGTPVFNALLLILINLAPGCLFAAACCEQHRSRSKQCQRNNSRSFHGRSPLMLSADKERSVTPWLGRRPSYGPGLSSPAVRRSRWV